MEIKATNWQLERNSVERRGTGHPRKQVFPHSLSDPDAANTDRETQRQAATWQYAIRHEQTLFRFLTVFLNFLLDISRRKSYLDI